MKRSALASVCLRIKCSGGVPPTALDSSKGGDGQWMRDWVERAQGDGAQVLNGEGLICNEAPDDDVQAACRKLGADLAAW